MKKIFTLIVAFIAITQMLNAQASHGAMTFVGKSNYYVTMMGSITGETTVAADTIVYMGADFTLPSMKYNDMVIPSFSIQGTIFTGGYAGVTWEDQTFTSTTTDASDQEKTITGSSLRGTFTHTAGIYKLQLEITFTYGNMPFPITYSIEGYYVKDYSGTNKVTVGGQYGPYSAQVTHKLRTYVEDGETKADVEIPGYTLPQTIMGNLTLGSYTITGLTYDESKGGYYKDYATDGLTIHITAEQNGTTTMDSDYELATSGSENILVQITDGKAKITNNFIPGAMPFPITAVMDQNATTGITQISTLDTHIQTPTYNLHGHRLSHSSQGLVIRNGKKYIAR